MPQWNINVNWKRERIEKHCDRINFYSVHAYSSNQIKCILLKPQIYTNSGNYTRYTSRFIVSVAFIWVAKANWCTRERWHHLSLHFHISHELNSSRTEADVTLCRVECLILQYFFDTVYSYEDDLISLALFNLLIIWTRLGVGTCSVQTSWMETLFAVTVFASVYRSRVAA